MQHAEHCAALDRELAEFRSLLVDADLSLPVPTCPRWDVLKLVSHLGGVQRWSAAMVEAVAPARIERRPEKPAESAMVEWFNEGTEILSRVLHNADPDAEMYAWGADQHARFWSRRQLHELVIHRYDLCNALGKPFSMTADIARDGIDEFLDNLPYAGYFAPNVANLVGNGESLHLHATDADGEWMITLNADGFAYEHGHGKGNVAVRGPIGDLALLMWGRRSIGDAAFETFGDALLLQHWIDNSAL